MRAVLGFLTVLGLLPLILSLTLRGILPVGTAVVLLLGITLAAAMRMSVARVLAPFIALYVFAADYSGGDPTARSRILSQLAALSLVLAGFYVMFSGLATGRKKNDR